MIESKFIKLFIIVVSLMILYGLIFLFCMLLLKPYHFRMKKSYFKKQPYPKPYQQKIEKNIFQIWIGSKLPKKFKKLSDYLKLQNPEYMYHLYDDTDIEKFIKTHYPEYLESYMSINSEYGPAKADFARYLLIYHYGGVYFDIKSGCNISLRNIIKPDDDIIIPEWNKIGLVIERLDWPAQWVIIGKSKNNFLKLLIDEMLKRIKKYDNTSEVGAFGVFKLTGPLLYKDVVEDYLNKQHKDKMRVIQSPNEFTYSWLNSNDMDWFNCGLLAITGYGECKHNLNKKEKRYTNKTVPIILNSKTKNE